MAGLAPQGKNPLATTDGELWRNLIMDLGFTGAAGLGGSIEIASGMGVIIAQLDQALAQYRPAGSGYAGGTAPTGTLGATALRQELSVAAAAFPGTGVLLLVQCHVPINTKVSNLNFLAGTTGDAGPNHSWMGLYDNSRNLLAVSADALATAITASAIATYPVANVTSTPGAPATAGASVAATSFTTYYTGRYYIGLLIATGNAPTFTAAAPVVAANNMVPINSGTSTGSLTTPSTIPTQAGTITATANVPYFFLT